jgi:UDP-N-acetylglucosamine/UDP-N-acetylgalactosamine diphosphorylase
LISISTPTRHDLDIAQGTRLGSTDPKGMYDLGLASHWTLFHVQAFRIVRLQQLSQQLYGGSGVIPWYTVSHDFSIDMQGTS